MGWSIIEVLKNPFALNNAKQNHDDSEDQQNVNESTHRVGGNHAEYPKHQQNHRDCLKHKRPFFVNMSHDDG